MRIHLARMTPNAAVIQITRKISHKSSSRLMTPHSTTKESPKYSMDSTNCSIQLEMADSQSKSFFNFLLHVFTFKLQC